VRACLSCLSSAAMAARAALAEFDLELLGLSIPARCFHLDLVKGSGYDFNFLQVHYSKSHLLCPRKDQSAFVSNERAIDA
jgi:hypothetical protein